MNTGTTLKGWLASLVVLGFFACLFVLFLVDIPGASKDVLLVVIGALIAAFKDVYGYYFGSSAGSDKKTDLLAASEPGPYLSQGKIGGELASRALADEKGFLRLSLREWVSLFASLVIVTVMFCMLPGCATTKSPQETAALSLLTTQKAVVYAAEVGNALCVNGKLEPPKCDRLRSAYEKAKPSYDLVADALVTYSKVNDATGQARYEAALSQFTPLADDFLRLAIEFNVIPKPAGGAK